MRVSRARALRPMAICPVLLAPPFCRSLSSRGRSHVELRPANVREAARSIDVTIFQHLPRKMVIKGSLTSLGAVPAITLASTSKTRGRRAGRKRRSGTTPSAETFNNVVLRQLPSALCCPPGTVFRAAARDAFRRCIAVQLCVPRRKLLIDVTLGKRTKGGRGEITGATSPPLSVTHSRSSAFVTLRDAIFFFSVPERISMEGKASTAHRSSGLPASVICQTLSFPFSSSRCCVSRLSGQFRERLASPRLASPYFAEGNYRLSAERSSCHWRKFQRGVDVNFPDDALTEKGLRVHC